MNFTFGGVEYQATSISVSRGAAEIDCSTLGLATNSFRRYRTNQIENIDIKVDWIGASAPGSGTATFSFSGLHVAGAKAIATGVSTTGTAGDLVKGSATFKVTYD